MSIVKTEKDVKKEYALLLFKQGVTQKEIAQRVGTTEQTLSKWAKDGKWDALRKSLLVTRQEQLGNLYEQLSELNTNIKSKPEGQRFANSKEADVLVKTTGAIRQLETETSVSDVVDVSIKCLNWLRGVEPAKAKEQAEIFDAFIKSLL